MDLDTALLPSPAEASVRLAELQGDVGRYLEDAKAPATRLAYRSDHAHFGLWCHQAGLSALPASAETVALYLAALAAAGARVSTLERRLASISVAHQMAGEESPTRSSLVRTTMAGVRRNVGSAPRQVAALRLTALKRLLDATTEETAAGVRDRAVLLLGFAGGFRRSELAALTISDIASVDEGLRITLRRSKTDQAAAGREVGIPRGRHPLTCPVTAVLRWITVAGLDAGPLFRRVDRLDRISAAGLSPQSIATVIQRAAARAGLDPADYAGHSLRAGFATEAAARGASERAIMAQTGHRSVTMVRRYIRDGGLFRENAAAQLGL